MRDLSSDMCEESRGVTCVVDMCEGPTEINMRCYGDKPPSCMAKVCDMCEGSSGV